MALDRTSVIVQGDGSIKFGDSAKVWFGDGATADNLAVGDVQVRWDGTDLDMLSTADDDVFKIGNGTLSMDLWVYGNTASDYVLWDASANLLALKGAASLALGNLGTIAAAGTTQGTATAVVNQVQIVTGADATKGVVLPAATPGALYILYNDHATAGLKVYPATGDFIGETAVDTAIVVEGAYISVFIAYDTTTWLPLYIVNV